MPSETKTSSHLWLGLLRFLVLLSKFVYQLATHVHNVNKCGMDNEPVPTKRCNGLWGCGDAGYRVFCFACERLLATNHAFSSALSSHKSLCPPPSDMATNTRVSGDVVCARTLHANLRGCRTGRGREGRNQVREKERRRRGKGRVCVCVCLCVSVCVHIHLSVFPSPPFLVCATHPPKGNTRVVSIGGEQHGRVWKRRSVERRTYAAHSRKAIGRVRVAPLIRLVLCKREAPVVQRRHHIDKRHLQSRKRERWGVSE